MTPTGWLLPLFTLGVYAFMGVVVGFAVAAIAALFRGVRPSAVTVDLVVGGLGGLLAAVIVGWVSADVTSFVNGRAVGGWQAFVVEHEYSVPVAFVFVLVVAVHVFVAMRHRAVPDAA